MHCLGPQEILDLRETLAGGYRTVGAYFKEPKTCDSNQSSADGHPGSADQRSAGSRHH